MKRESDMSNSGELRRLERITRLEIEIHEKKLMELDKKRTDEITLIEKLKIKLEQIEHDLSKPICTHCHCVINSGTYSTDGIDGVFCSKQCLLEEVGNHIQCANNDESNIMAVKDVDEIGIVGEDDDPWYEKIEKRIEEFGYGFSSDEVYWLIIKETGMIRKEDKKKLDMVTYTRIGKILRLLGYGRKVMRNKDGNLYNGWYKLSIDGVQNDEWFNIIKNGIVGLCDKFTTNDVYCAIIKKYTSNVSEDMSRRSAIRICRILRCLGYSTCKYNVDGGSISLWKKINLGGVK